VQSESRSSPPVRSSSRPAPRRRLSVDRRRDELIEAALDLLSKRGPEEVSVDDVAQAAGASRALVYHYFGTKQDLYAAALSKAAAELTRRLSQVEPGDTVTITPRPGAKPQRFKVSGIAIVSASDVLFQPLNPLFGPAPAELLPATTDQELFEFVRRDLREFWLPATRKRTPWYTDIWVDLSLLTIARA